MSENKKRWYVLRAISGKEAKVKEILDAACKNTDLGKYVSQVLIPTEKVYVQRNGKKAQKDRNLYSGYVFIEAQLTGEVIYEIKNTTNVIDFLRGRGVGAAPEALRESEVERMLGKADELSETPEQESVEFSIGDAVKVNAGAFSGFRGVVTEVNTERKKVKVEVKIFDRAVDVELENSQVERE